MLVLYVSPTARHSRQAQEWLRERRICYQERNIFSSLLTKEEFMELCFLLQKKQHSLLSLLGISPQAPITLFEEECYQLLYDAPESLKRPILKGRQHIAVGFSPQSFEHLVREEGIPLT